MSAGLWSLKAAFRPYAKALVDVMTKAGANPNVTSTKRSVATQAKLYKAWVEGRSPYPAAPPGSSQHGKGLAFDVTIADMKQMEIFGRLWESLGKGFRWGGRFGDPVHFDYRP
jgi:hypothetical protein